MIVSETQLKKWNELHMKGDYYTIIASMDAAQRPHYETLRRSMKTGKFHNPELLKAVNDFYKKRGSLVD